MTIYLAFFQSTTKHSIPAYSFWEYYIKNGIEEAGYQWEEGQGDWAEGLVHSFDKKKLEHWKTETWEKTLRDIKAKHSKKPVSLFLSYLYPHQIDENAIREIQKLGIPCVNFYCDNVRQFTTIPREFGVFDLNWVPEFKALEMYQRKNYKFLYLPMPVWVAPTRRELVYREQYKPTFIGSCDIQRGILFQSALKKYGEIELRGPGWGNDDRINAEAPLKELPQSNIIKNQFGFIYEQGLKAYFYKLYNKLSQPRLDFEFLKAFTKESVFGEDYFEVTKNAIITIGVNRYPSFRHPILAPDTYSRLRDIEAPMLGACYLTEWTEGLDTMYDLGKEIEVYNSSEELIEKIKELISDSNKRKSMRVLAQKRALNNYAITQSLNRVISNFYK